MTKISRKNIVVMIKATETIKLCTVDTQSENVYHVHVCILGLAWHLSYYNPTISWMQVVLQFYPWFKFYFCLFLGIVMHDNEFESKENKIWTKDKIEPQHIQRVIDLTSDINFFSRYAYAIQKPSSLLFQ